MIERERWSRQRAQWPWRDFLTADEAAMVDDELARQEVARRELAEATAIINPIRNRAIHRAKYAALRAHQQPQRKD